MSIKPIASIVFVSCLVLTSCGGSSSTSSTGLDTSPSPPPPPAPPPPPPPPSPPPPPPPASAEVIFVDPSGNDANDGSESAPLASIQAAVDLANAGITISVRSGIYNERVRFEGSADSGTSSQPVTLQADTGAVISGTGLSPNGREGLITIEGASHIVIDGFELSNFKTVVGNSINDTPVGILIFGSATNVKLSNNVIHDIANQSTCHQNNSNCYPGANGIGIYGTTSSGLVDIRVISNTVYNNTLAASEAVVFNGNVSRFVCVGNIVRDNNNIAFDFIGLESDTCPSCSDATNRARDGLVRGNIALRNSTRQFAGNPWYGNEGSAGGFYVDGGRNIVLERNISSQNDIGIEIASEAPGGETSDILVASNLVYNNFEAGIAIGGYAGNASNSGGGSSNRITVANNTFYHNKGWGSEVYLQYRVHDLEFSNNIVFGETSISDSYEQAGNNTQGSNQTFSNNVWWASGSKNTVPVSDASAIKADPLFSNPATGTFTMPNGSPAVDAGEILGNIINWTSTFWSAHYVGGSIPISGSTDVNGNARTITVIDAGATEQ